MTAVIIALLIAILVLLLWLIAMVYSLREQIADAVKNQVGSGPHLGTRHHGHAELNNYGVWTYRQGRWSLVEDRSLAGYTCGDPPRRAGTYEGETVRKPAVRRGPATS